MFRKINEFFSLEDAPTVDFIIIYGAVGIGFFAVLECFVIGVLL